MVANDQPESRSLTQWLADNAPDCGDNSCLFGGRGKGGMRTNGGCRCFRDLPTMKRIYIERMQAALSERSESTATEKGSAAEALALFEWAERNPEAARSCIDALWAQCGRGGREDFFNYRKCIRDAMRLGERQGG